MPKSEAEVALEIYESVQQSRRKQKRLKSTTFWRLFHVKARHDRVVARIKRILDDQGLKVSVKSGARLGEEEHDDWIMLVLKLTPPPPDPPHVSVTQLPSSEWFEMIQERSFESEREVEAYFILPLLEQLGYEYDDIVIGYPVTMYKGVRRTNTEADFAIFRDSARDEKGVLLVVEAKKSDRGITVDHINQARSYAQVLLPAYYIVTNAQRITVYQFNGMLAPDECVVDLDRTELQHKWEELYGYASKEAALNRKDWLLSKMA